MQNLLLNASKSSLSKQNGVKTGIAGENQQNKTLKQYCS
jgi:hypothetical protein